MLLLLSFSKAKIYLKLFKFDKKKLRIMYISVFTSDKVAFSLE